MRNGIPRALAALAVILLLAGPSLADTPAKTALDKDAIGRIVRDYLLANPEVIDEALQVLRTKRRAEAQVRARAAIRKNRAALTAHPMSPVSGDANGDVTVVEFFDYQCGYCKRSLKPMLDLLGADKRVRVVWKEFPILGPVSTFAAHAAMAADRQGLYHEFHVALMGAREKLTKERVLRIAAKTGLDVERLSRDMNAPAIAAYLAETRKLARAIGISGTPAFVIGETFVPGAIDGVRMKELVAEARSGQ